ncbi:aspartate aminotransferase family protein [Brevibacillus choshinensis]|uniref:Aspartate aminotransferase family protein n=1 Tax=Brevibacillus choshinensis TaxID=54911 RepID=A0ABX7FSC5_BRECH|nr:aspartate aminotransferase family protein [Brevibacillus choshinensis]QRG69148.1 aspartate aminotransferase family protein [Brevibacillus choshinensis]
MKISSLQATFQASRPQSAAFFERAKHTISGGVNGNLRYFAPFPIIFEKAEAASLIDLDGHRYVDYLLSYGALMLGHAHPEVLKATQEVWEKQGTSSFGATHPLEMEMTDELLELYPSFDQVRFTNSGLEATLFALRLATAYTGKSHIAKFEGHYHGAHDHVLQSVNPTADLAGTTQAPHPVPESLGTPEYYRDHSVILPFNDWDACERILTENADLISSVIMEPMLSGYIAADRTFMKNLRELTTKLGIVLIFDEVKTGFRIEVGGAQAFYGVQPDLTALGKVVGGGFPIGVVGGKRDIMELASPLRSSKKSEVVFHSGTFNGNPLSIAAGLATIRYLKQPGNFAQIVAQTNELRTGIDALAKEYALPFHTLGEGTIFNVLATGETVGHYRDLGKNNNQLRLALDYLLMENGVYSKPMNRFSLSAAHGPAEVKATLDAFEKSMAALKQDPLV